jgi:glycosyltransferase involved in cell wall biosynthesis
VTINGSWPNQKAHEITFPNPSLTQADIDAGTLAAQEKQLKPPYRCVFVGRLEKAKGAPVLIEAVHQLREAGVEIEADLIGGGPEADEIRRSAQDLTAAGSVRFHGWLPRHEIPRFLSPAHFVVLPTNCASEGMAYGAVPMATALSAIPHYLTTKENGWLLQQPTAAEVRAGISWFLTKPDRWKYCQTRALGLARQFTYAHYLGKVLELRETGQRGPQHQVAGPPGLT